MLDDDEQGALSFFNKKRRQVRSGNLRYQTESLFMIGPTDAIVPHKLGAIRREFEGAVFVSHTRDDQHFIKENLLQPLRQRASVFFHNRVTPGNETYVHTVGHALLACGSALVVLSNSCIRSQWVSKEVDVILARRIPVVFFVRDDVRTKAIHEDIPKRFGIVDRWWFRRYIFYLAAGRTALAEAIRSIEAKRD